MKNQRIRWSTVRLAVLAFVVLALFGCAMGGETITERIETFVSAVNNNDLTAVKASLDTSAAAYNTGVTTTWLDTYFPNKPYSVGSVTTAGNVATATLTSTTNLTYVFEMTEEEGGLFAGSTYRIRKIGTTNGTYFFQ